MAAVRDEHFLQGLRAAISRVKWFHEQDAFLSMGERLARRRPSLVAVFAMVRVANVLYLGNYVLLCVIIMFSRRITVSSADVRIFEYGFSRNNLLAFGRVNDCLAGDVDPKVEINGRRLGTINRISCVFSSKTIHAARVLGSLTCSSTFCRLQVLLAAAYYLCFFEFGLSDEVGVVGVANDHSPGPVGVAIAARHRGRKVFYVQHAAISDLFPSLDIFDLSFLHNAVSEEIYARRAQKTGERAEPDIAFLHACRGDFVFPKLERKGLSVAICLSSLPNIERVRGVLETLVGNSHVSRILVRPHPRYPYAGRLLKRSCPMVELRPKNEALEDFLCNSDVLISPNSGVGVEALHYGVPVAYVDGMDYVQRDYYGFVREEIVPEVEVDKLSFSQIADFYSAEWRERFARFDPTVTQSTESLRRQARLRLLSML